MINHQSQLVNELIGLSFFTLSPFYALSGRRIALVGVAILFQIARNGFCSWLTVDVVKLRRVGFEVVKFPCGDVVVEVYQYIALVFYAVVPAHIVLVGELIIMIIE